MWCVYLFKGLVLVEKSISQNYHHMAYWQDEHPIASQRKICRIKLLQHIAYHSISWTFLHIGELLIQCSQPNTTQTKFASHAAHNILIHLCHNVYNMIQLIASHASHSISNIMCTIQHNTYHHYHLMHHRASMPQCVQYDTTQCISCITQHL